MGVSVRAGRPYVHYLPFLILSARKDHVIRPYCVLTDISRHNYGIMVLHQSRENTRDLAVANYCIGVCKQSNILT